MKLLSDLKSRFFSNKKAKGRNTNVGDMVMFCLNPPADPEHCNIWEWATGILIEIDRSTGNVHILHKGEVHEVHEKWIGPPDMLEKIREVK